MLLLLFFGEIVRLFLVFNIAAVVLNGEGYLDAGILLFFIGVPALMFPVAFMSLYQHPDNAPLKLLLVLGKGLMILAGVLLLFMVSSLGMILAQLAPGLISFRFPASIVSLQALITLLDLICLVVLLLFKPTREKRGVAGIPAPPVVRIEEE